MSEPRRVGLSSSVPLDNNNKSEKSPPVIRFELDLGESNDKTCPEFSYLELLKNAVNHDDDKLKEMDPFAAQDIAEQRKLEALAVSFEDKYGKKAKKKHMRRSKIGRLQDLIDLGDGYDETDPFVDNSEAYDEVVPLSLTTKLGGFYINSGVLDFRQISDDSDDTDFQTSTMLKKKKKKIKRITSDSDESDVNESVKKEENSLVKPKKNKVFIDNDVANPKKKIKLTKNKSNTGDSVVKEPTSTSPANKSSTVNGNANADSSSGSSSSESGDSDLESSSNGSDVESEEENVSAQSAKLSELDSTINSVINKGANQIHKGGEAQLHREDHVSVTSNNNVESSPTTESEVAPKLPDSIPEGLRNKIDRIKLAAIQSANGKRKFFNPGVNKLLLGIDKECRVNMRCSSRTMVFNHLAAFLPCSKETLVKRAKNLRTMEQGLKTKEPLDNLREEINRIMPAVIEKYNADCQATSLLRLQVDEKPVEKDGESGAESDGILGTENNQKINDAKPKRIHKPHRRFPWTVLARNSLCEVVEKVIQSYAVQKKQGQSVEDFVKAYIESALFNLWPKGWMNVRVIYKESRTAHERFTNPSAVITINSKLKKQKEKGDVSAPGVASMTPLPVPPAKKKQPVQKVVYPYMLPDSSPTNPVLKPIPTPPTTPKPKTIRLSTGNAKPDDLDMKFIDKLFDPSTDLPDVDMKDFDTGAPIDEEALMDLFKDSEATDLMKTISDSGLSENPVAKIRKVKVPEPCVKTSISSSYAGFISSQTAPQREVAATNIVSTTTHKTSPKNRTSTSNSSNSFLSQFEKFTSSYSKISPTKENVVVNEWQPAVRPAEIQNVKRVAEPMINHKAAQFMDYSKPTSIGQQLQNQVAHSPNVMSHGSGIIPTFPVSSSQAKQKSPKHSQLSQGHGVTSCIMSSPQQRGDHSKKLTPPRLNDPQNIYASNRPNSCTNIMKHGPDANPSDSFGEFLRNMFHKPTSSPNTAVHKSPTSVLSSAPVPMQHRPPVLPFTHQGCISPTSGTAGHVSDYAQRVIQSQQHHKLIQQQQSVTPNLLQAALLNPTFGQTQQSHPISAHSLSQGGPSTASLWNTQSQFNHGGLTSPTNLPPRSYVENSPSHHQRSPGSLSNVGMYSPTDSPMGHTPISPQGMFPGVPGIPGVPGTPSSANTRLPWFPPSSR